MGYITRRVLQKDAPIILGYWVLGMACGMLGEKAGLNPFHMFIMSVLAFAGSSQFIGIAMMFLCTFSCLFVALILCFLIFRDNLIIEFFPEILCNRIADILIDWLALLVHLLCLIRRH